MGATAGAVTGRNWTGPLAGDRRLEVLEPLAPLLPGGGLQRGSTVVVAPAGAPGATSLALALMGGASRAGSWCAVVGLPGLGVVAAAQMGLRLERLALVADPGDQWPTAAAALLDSVEVVVICPPSRPRPGDSRRLVARARERGSVAVVLSAAWAERADVRLEVHGATWSGLGAGHGHLQGRLVEVVSAGRGWASGERRARLWLPGPTGAPEATAGGAPAGGRPSQAG
ncbi:MAG: hypothetical protein ACRDY0_04185 [Acidimicrobiales bacterium]